MSKRNVEIIPDIFRNFGTFRIPHRLYQKYINKATKLQERKCAALCLSQEIKVAFEYGFKDLLNKNTVNAKGPCIIEMKRYTALWLILEANQFTTSRTVSLAMASSSLVGITITPVLLSEVVIAISSPRLRLASWSSSTPR